MIILFIISLIIDFIINYYLPFLPSFLIYLKPLLFISTIISYIIFFNNKKNMIKKISIIIILYDLFFCNIKFMCILTFYILYFIITFLMRKIKLSFSTYIFLFLFSLILYLSIKYLILVLTGISNYSIFFLLNQISYSVIFNVFYSLFLYYFFGLKKEIR